MEQSYVNPVNHGKLSATATTVAEAGKSGLKGVVAGGLIGLALVAGVGALVVGGIAAAVGASFGGILLMGGLGALGGGVVGSSVGGLGAGIGAIFGTAKGASRGISRVGQEQGAANELQAQIEVAKAQSMGGNTNIYANDNKYGFHAQGSAMNAAASSIQLDSKQMDGRIGGPELAAARG